MFFFHFKLPIKKLSNTSIKYNKNRYKIEYLNKFFAVWSDFSFKFNAKKINKPPNIIAEKKYTNPENLKK